MPTASTKMFDSLIAEFDMGLRTLFAAAPTMREYPGQGCRVSALTDADRVHAAALMRVNHVGEVCAQALYQGQALACRDQKVRKILGEAAREEVDHLAWTTQRINELGSRKSLLNPFWYIGAFSLGALAGSLGDGWSLGFLAETERQVGKHLDHHLSKLPERDTSSHAIVQQMKIDEMRHADTAVGLGARELPAPVKLVMRLAAGVMTRAAYYL
jgi:3-demethoxyubiquinol 3-hydroxylase